MKKAKGFWGAHESMPELPEVETMVRGLRPAMTGQKLHHLTIHDPFLLQGCTSEEIERQGNGVKVTGVKRRGKWVVIELDSDRGIIVIQPRMTGGFWLIPPDHPGHVRLSFDFKKPDRTIWFCDARRLGKIAWYPTAELAESAFSVSHGVDALKITQQELSDRLSQTSRGIKPTLMDQKVVAGIGNIYADEVLFQARIHPERMSSQLTSPEIRQIHAAIGDVLARAIAAEGSSFDAGYRTVLGLEGGFLAQNTMYGRGGKPCPGCGGLILKTKIAGLVGRPTHYCPVCQPAR